jgi:hypothetical protein
MFMKQLTATMTAVALLLPVSRPSLADDLAEKKAQEKADKDWQDEAMGRWREEQSRKAEQEKTRRDSSSGDSRCGAGCAVAVGVTALALYGVCRALGGCGADEEVQRTKEQARGTPPSSPSERSWRVYGDLNMRELPRPNAPKVGTIRAETGGIRLGNCVREEWTRESAARGSFDPERVWCEAQFDGQTGWVSAKYLFSEQ